MQRAQAGGSCAENEARMNTRELPPEPAGRGSRGRRAPLVIAAVLSTGRAHKSDWHTLCAGNLGGTTDTAAFVLAKRTFAAVFLFAAPPKARKGKLRRRDGEVEKPT